MSNAMEREQPKLRREQTEIWAIKASGLDVSRLASLDTQASLPIQATVVDSVAVLPLHGVLIDGEPFWSDEISYDSVAISAAKLTADSAIKAIVLDINSPGGSAYGAIETARLLASLAQAKPIVSLGRGLMASAAYMLALGAGGGIWSTPSTEVGSIGVLVPVYDVSGWMAQQGVTVELFTSGPLKGTGFPGTQLSAAQRAALQQLANSYADIFFEWVSSRRPAAALEVFDGGTYVGETAGEMGLINGVIGGLGEAIDFARRLTASPPGV